MKTEHPKQLLSVCKNVDQATRLTTHLNETCTPSSFTRRGKNVYYVPVDVRQRPDGSFIVTPPEGTHLQRKAFFDKE